MAPCFFSVAIKNAPRCGTKLRENYIRDLALVTDGGVDEHPYQPYQRSNTNDAVNDAAEYAARAEQPRNQVEAKDSNQTPVQGADYRQWYQNIVC